MFEDPAAWCADRAPGQQTPADALPLDVRQLQNSALPIQVNKLSPCGLHQSACKKLRILLCSLDSISVVMLASIRWLGPICETNGLRPCHNSTHGNVCGRNAPSKDVQIAVQPASLHVKRDTYTVRQMCTSVMCMQERVALLAGATTPNGGKRPQPFVMPQDGLPPWPRPGHHPAHPAQQPACECRGASRCVHVSSSPTWPA